MIDVALCAYGKPYQTALTLASLQKHSGHLIGKVFFQCEAAQPHGQDLRGIPSLFPDLEIITHVPESHLKVDLTDRAKLSSPSYRHSIRYQFAWENSDADQLFICHNDCLFTGDALGEMSSRMGNFCGVGWIGQCWNCPAAYAGKCNSEKFDQWHPDYAEALAVVREFPGIRTPLSSLSREAPFPLPECRLNEFACLINLKKLRPLVCPVGPVVPFGSFFIDTGTQWFREVYALGGKFLNFFPHTSHAPFAPGAAGHHANLDKNLHDLAEGCAREHLRNFFPKTFFRMEPEMTFEQLKPHVAWSVAGTIHHIFKQSLEPREAYKGFMAEGGPRAYAIRFLPDDFMQDLFIDKFMELSKSEGYL